MNKIKTLIEKDISDKEDQKKVLCAYKLDPEIIAEIKKQAKAQSKTTKKKISESAIVRAALRIGLGLTK